MCAKARISADWAAGLSHHAHPWRFANFVDQDRRTVGQLAIAERIRRGLEGKIEGRMHSDQPSPAHDGEFAAVLIEKSLLATIEKGGFLGGGKHALGSGMKGNSSTKRVTQRVHNRC
jgi:hypothetical protein